MSRLRILVAALLLAVVVLSGSLSVLYTDYLWFDDLGLASVFWFRVWVKAAIFAAAFAASLAITLGNLAPVFRRGEMAVVIPLGRMQEVWIRYGELLRRYFKAAFSAAAAVVSLVAAAQAAGAWETVVLFARRVPADVEVPVYDLDAGFFLFELPFYTALANWLFSMLLVTLGLVALAYFLRSVAGTMQSFRMTFAWFKEHFFGLLAALSFVEAGRLYLGTFSSAYSPRGAVFGPAYTDVHATIPGFAAAAAAFAALGAVFAYAALAKSGWRLPLAAAAAAAAVAFAATTLYPAVVQAYVVAPSELSKERPYIRHHIVMTRKAYDIERFGAVSHEPPGPVTEAALAANRTTIESVRLWDWRPLLSTYQQLQAIRTYYTFADLDLDRYSVGGRLRQLAVGARELSVDDLPDRAKTWVNLHLKYTHGYGLVASPVNEVVGEGLPNFFLKDIPVVASDASLALERPQIYFGELTNHYVIVRTKEREFDYPSGEANAYTHYEGTTGISLAPYLTKLAFAVRFGTLKILLTDAITPDSRMLFDRNIVARARKIAPFLAYDSDPYPVVADGRVYWVLDGYTTSARFPYSQPIDENGTNYVRNAVKVVVDAYSGETAFYVWDERDPLVRAYARVFPAIFRGRGEIPRAILAHIRYPEDYFRIQAAVLATYHMLDPDVFYNREDQWVVARELFDQGTVDVDPYYVIMELPDRPGLPFTFTKPEFLTMLPFTPRGKSNMISWLFVSSDDPHYGQGGYFVFEKGRLVYGPMQIESRIDQDPVISQQITLWNQSGSRVIRGNLLVVPLDGSLLYVEPLYLQSEQSQIPELKRVIVASQNTVIMADSLADGLARLVGKAPPPSTPGGAAPPAAEMEKARELMRAIDESLRRGDFAGFGEKLELLRELLAGGEPTATTEASR